MLVNNKIITALRYNHSTATAILRAKSVSFGGTQTEAEGPRSQQNSADSERRLSSRGGPAERRGPHP